MTWERDESGLSLRDIERKRSYVFEAHSFAVAKKIPYLRCKHCGLLTLRNALTEWCTKVGCNAADHAEYASRVKNSKPREAA